MIFGSKFIKRSFESPVTYLLVKSVRAGRERCVVFGAGTDPGND